MSIRIFTWSHELRTTTNGCRWPVRAGQRAGVLGRFLTARGRKGFATTFAVDPGRAQASRRLRIEHRCWLCINAKEAENVSLSRQVIAMIPEFPR